MRFTPILLTSLASVTLAQDQIPLRDTLEGWFAKAKSYIPSTPPSPMDAGASKVAAHKITELTTTNWKYTLSPSPSYDATATTPSHPETWMILVTGGNRTCEGKCGRLGAEFNKTTALLSADPSATAPRFGLVDCDRYGVLCATWMAGPPSLWYVQLPVYAAGLQSPAHTDVYVKHLNLTETRAADLVRFYKQAEWKEMKPLESIFHPFNGELAKYGLQVPLGYVLFAFSMIPSWGLMIGVSFLTRTYMSRRPPLGGQQGATRNAGIPRGGAPAANERPK